MRGRVDPEHVDLADRRADVPGRVHLGPVEAEQPAVGRVRTASRKPAGSNHGSASAHPQVAGGPRPCSGWSAKARALSASQAASSAPGPEGAQRRRRPAARPRQRGRRSEAGAAARAPGPGSKPQVARERGRAGWSPCAHSRSGRRRRRHAAAQQRAAGPAPPVRGCTTSSAPAPATVGGPGGRSRPARRPARTSRCTAAPAPACRSRSTTCSASGWTPSASPRRRQRQHVGRPSARVATVGRAHAGRRADRSAVARSDAGGPARRRAAAAVASAAADELVADLADRADHRLVLRAELGAQPPDVHVDRAGAAEVVVAPDLAQQLVAGEDPARVLGQELQQLELLVGEVERPALELGGVRVRVDGQLAGPDRAAGAGGRVAQPADARGAAGPPPRPDRRWPG